MVLIDIGHDHPGFGSARREIEFSTNKIGAFFGFDVLLLYDISAFSKVVELQGRQQVRRIFQTEAKGYIGLERFAGFGFIHNIRAKGVDAQAGGTIQFAAFVRIDKVAGLDLEFAPDTVWNQVLNAVQRFDV